MQCPLCSSNARHLFVSKDYNRRITAEAFEYRRCVSCGTIFLENVPEDLSMYYPDDYHATTLTADLIDKISGYERYKIDMITPHVQSGRLLEIGPSIGTFSYLAKKSGFTVEAIEMDSKCSRFLNESLGIHTTNTADICAALRTAGKYDVIALWHVFEHLPNPREVLEAIRESLTENGILVLAAPNPESFQFRIMGRYWPHLDAPRHVALFPMQALEDCAAAIGLAAVSKTTSDERARGWNRFGWSVFFSNLTANEKLKPALAGIGSWIYGQTQGLEKKGYRGSAYTMIFRRRPS